MLITEIKDGLTHTYSDAGYLIIQNGTEIEYYEAYDPIDSRRTYRESDKLIEEEGIEFDPEPSGIDEETLALAQAARIMLGLGAGDASDEEGDNE